MLNFFTSISRPYLFSKFAVIFTVVLIIGHVVFFEFYARDLVERNNVGLTRYKDLIQYGEKYHVAAVGTSHTDEGLIKSTETFFNYGRMFTWYPEVAVAKVKHLIKNAPNLQVLLLEADHLDVFKYSSALHSKRPQIHGHLLEKVDRDKGRLGYIKLVSLQDEVAPGLHKKLLQDLLIANESEDKEVVNHNWEKFDKVTKEGKAKRRVKAQLLHYPRKIDDNVKKYYSSSISLAKEHGVAVYLVVFPQTEEYLKAIHQANKTNLSNYLSTLQNEFGVHILDYQNAFNNQPEYFANQDHLNNLGAKALTTMVLRDINAAVN